MRKGRAINSLRAGAGLHHDDFPFLIFALHELGKLRGPAAHRVGALADQLLLDGGNGVHVVDGLVARADDILGRAFVQARGDEGGAAALVILLQPSPG